MSIGWVSGVATMPKERLDSRAFGICYARPVWTLSIDEWQIDAAGNFGEVVYRNLTVAFSH
jgi:hypothetical protein